MSRSGISNFNPVFRLDIHFWNSFLLRKFEILLLRTVGAGGTGGARADQLAPSQPGGTLCPIHYYLPPSLGFSDLPTTLNQISSRVANRWPKRFMVHLDFWRNKGKARIVFKWTFSFFFLFSDSSWDVKPNFRMKLLFLQSKCRIMWSCWVVNFPKSSVFWYWWNHFVYSIFPLSRQTI